MGQIISLDELEEQLLAGPSRINSIARRVLTSATVDLKDEARRNMGARLKERSRSLIKSLRHEIMQADDVIEGKVIVGGDYQGLKVRHGAIHEYGGLILPKNGKFLTIPVEEGLNAIGLAKYESVRQMPFAEFRKGSDTTHRNAVWLVVDKRNDKLWYVLVPSTRIKEQRFMRDALDTISRGFPDRLASAAAEGLLAA